MSNKNYSIVYLFMNIIAAFGHFYLRVCKLGSLSLSKERDRVVLLVECQSNRKSQFKAINKMATVLQQVWGCKTKKQTNRQVFFLFTLFYFNSNRQVGISISDHYEQYIAISSSFPPVS